MQDISDAIDTILSKEWTEKERGFYQMLLGKVSQYRDMYRDTTPRVSLSQTHPSAISDILQNIREQPLYHKCRHREELERIVQSLVVMELEDSPEEFKLKLQLNPGRHFIAQWTPTRYRVHFENTHIHGYIAYYNSVTQKKRHLPEYTELEQVLPGLDRVEIIHLATELLAYFDVNGRTSKTPLGVAYPISLPELARESA